MTTAAATRDQRRQQLNGETLLALAAMATEAGIPNADLMGFSDLVEALLDRPAGPAPDGGRRFSKPQPARQLEARGRARTLGVRVEVVVEARHYRTRSQSQPGEAYQLVRTRDGWCCSCQGDDAPTVVAVPTADSQSARAARTRAALADLGSE